MGTCERPNGQAHETHKTKGRTVSHTHFRNDHDFGRLEYVHLSLFASSSGEELGSFVSDAFRTVCVRMLTSNVFEYFRMVSNAFE